MKRFDPRVGVIKSWDEDKGWQGERGWQYPVIVDNMMNLELLFIVSEFTGDPTYKTVAITHANTTLKNHFRKDNSSYHVVDYDSLTGAVRSKVTAQGYTNESSWARGQAWGLYGYTMCYRFTKDKAYLNKANEIAQLIMEKAKTKNGNIPFWDYQAPNIPNEPRDASAAAITAAALLELNNYTDGYKSYAQDIIVALSGSDYLSKHGNNQGFLIMHNVGSVPHKNEIDVPLNYADYYFLEALVRLNN